VSDSTGTTVDGVAYENTADPAWGRRALESYQRRELQVQALDTEGVVSSQVWGPCPRCGHPLNVQQTLSVPIAGLRGGIWESLTGREPHADSGIPDTVEVGCGCDNYHPGAPEQVRGCGVSFRLPTAPPAPPATMQGAP
jgi:hypothetical protein